MKVISNSKLCGEYDQRFIPLNRAFYFDGATYLSIAALSTNVVSDGIFSIAMWVKPGEVVGSTHRVLFGFSKDANNFFYFRCPQAAASALSGFGKIDSVIFSAATNHTISDVEWFHFTCVFENSVYKYYINNVISDTETGKPDILNFVGVPAFSLGVSGSTKNLGHLAGIHIYNKALSQAEVTNLYNGVAVSGAVASYPYWTDADKAAGTGVTDATANGNDLTLTGNTNIYAYVGAIK